jgi:S1-C subfamily serine protease
MRHTLFGIGLVCLFIPSALGAPPPAPPSKAIAATGEARRLSDAFVAAAEKASPSVVQIEVTTRSEVPEEIRSFFGLDEGDQPTQHGLGSGVVFTADGAILTNNHVINDAVTMNVRLRDGRTLAAKLIGRDAATDLAVLKVDATGLAAATFADSSSARVGEWVVAIGSPSGLGYSVTAGVVSAKARGDIGASAIEDYLQTDASINPGNSGGPLCNLDGHVLGINTLVLRSAQGIGFSVSSNLARRVAQQILKNGFVQRAWLGVAPQPLTPELATAFKVQATDGVLVGSVVESGPASKANMKSGDIVATVAGKKVHTPGELTREVTAHEVGEVVDLEIIRNQQRYNTKVTLGTRPDKRAPIPAQAQTPPATGLGFSVKELGAEQAQSLGLPPKAVSVVSSVAVGSAADRAGLRPGDIVAEADGVPDPSPAQVQKVAADGELLLRVRRKDAFFYAALKK